MTEYLDVEIMALDSVRELECRIGIAIRRNCRHAGLRKTLPKLVSGEIEVRAAEAIAEEVA